MAAPARISRPPTGATQVAPGPSDDDLLAGFAADRPGAAQALTDRLLPRAYGVALRVLGDPAEAEDAAQEAMLRLWRMAPDWEPGRAQASTWLYRVTMNLCIDIRRKRHGGAVDLDAVPEPADAAPGAAERLQQGARHDALQAALMRLPERQRQAVVLRHLEELSNPEIARIMGIGTEAVESLTARGKRALPAILAAVERGAGRVPRLGRAGHGQRRRALDRHGPAAGPARSGRADAGARGGADRTGPAGRRQPDPGDGRGGLAGC